MLVLHKNYQFTHRDIGKKVLLSNHQVVKILTVIREAGQTHSLYGVAKGFTDVIAWDAKGRADTPEQNIIMLYESDGPDGESAD